jgi:hypothetical protein
MGREIGEVAAGVAQFNSGEGSNKRLLVIRAAGFRL